MKEESILIVSGTYCRLVIFDTVYVPLGEMRFKRHGSHGGQKGMENIINVLKTENFPRLAIGIGPKPNVINLLFFLSIHFSHFHFS
jgi:PTH1 family peptidyl-tRNA hydrolase